MNIRNIKIIEVDVKFRNFEHSHTKQVCDISQETPVGPCFFQVDDKILTTIETSTFE